MVTMDRGYPSMPSFLRMIDGGGYFVARLKSSDFKEEQKALSSDDEDMDIKITKSRRHHYLGTSDEEIVMSRDSFPFRMLCVWLDEEKRDFEILATNLPSVLGKSITYAGLKCRYRHFSPTFFV